MFFRERGEEEKDIRKIAAAAVIFVIALIVFGIPGLFQSVEKETMESIEIIIYLLIYLGAGHDVVVGSITKIFSGRFQYVRLTVTVVTLALFCVGMHQAACAILLAYMMLEYYHDGVNRQIGRK